MSVFSVLLLTTAPPGQGADGTGANVKVDGREALLRSVELFLNRDNIKQIQLVFAAENMEEAKRKFGGHLSFSGVKLAVGGPRWLEQAAAGAKNIASECTHVIVHDAARPAVPYNDIDALMEAAQKSDAVALCAPSRSLLAEVDEGGNPVAFCPASRFVQILWPQAFSKEKFLDWAGNKKELHASQFKLVRAWPWNLRVSGSADAGMVKTMISMMPKPKIKPPSSPFEEAQW